MRVTWPHKAYKISRNSVAVVVVVVEAVAVVVVEVAVIVVVVLIVVVVDHVGRAGGDMPPTLASDGKPGTVFSLNILVWSGISLLDVVASDSKRWNADICLEQI